jgi:FkbM family methyltransferase
MLRKIKGRLSEILPENILNIFKRVHSYNLLKKYSEKEELDFKIVKYMVKKGDTVIDIGANIGCYTKLLSELVAERGMVISIEPIQCTFLILSSCVKRLNLTNGTLLNCAISDCERIAKMEVQKYDSGGFNFYQSKIIDTDAQKSAFKYFSVPKRPLDNCVSYLKQKVSFIKCDVEGRELEVIKGAMNILTKFKPIWLIEISSRSG